jgi:nucleoside-diphosphate-sugar epimerase
MPMPELRGRQVLVTGAAGFIGSHLVDELVRAGARVRALDNFSTGKRENISHFLDRIDFVEGDLREADVCQRVCRDVEFVFHQAALGSIPRSMSDPATTFAVNVCGAANILAASRDNRVRRVIFASSSSVYGSSQTIPKREGEEGRPISPYAASKQMNEELADLFGRCFGVETIGLRYFNVYGPRQDPLGPYAAVIPLFFKAYFTGTAPTIFGDGEQSRDFTFVSDVVRANLLAAGASRDVCGRAYNVGGGKRTTLNDLARAVRAIAGSKREPRYADPRPGDVRDSMADGALAAEALGYIPEFTLAEGLARAAQYYETRSGETSVGRRHASEGSLSASEPKKEMET